jgi:hypothetical protein
VGISLTGSDFAAATIAEPMPADKPCVCRWLRLSDEPLDGCLRKECASPASLMAHKE